MTDFGNVPYKVRSTDPNDLLSECNRVFELISDRLDRIEGHRGEPTLYARQFTDYDTVYSGTNKGVVLKDDATPANYWRLTIDNTGTLVQTNIGRSAD